MAFFLLLLLFPVCQHYNFPETLKFFTLLLILMTICAFIYVANTYLLYELQIFPYDHKSLAIKISSLDVGGRRCVQGLAVVFTKQGDRGTWSEVLEQPPSPVACWIKCLLGFHEEISHGQVAPRIWCPERTLGIGNNTWDMEALGMDELSQQKSGNWVKS